MVESHRLWKHRNIYTEMRRKQVGGNRVSFRCYNRYDKCCLLLWSNQWVSAISSQKQIVCERLDTSTKQLRGRQTFVISRRVVAEKTAVHNYLLTDSYSNPPIYLTRKGNTSPKPQGNKSMLHMFLPGGVSVMELFYFWATTASSIEHHNEK